AVLASQMTGQPQQREPGTGELQEFAHPLRADHGQCGGSHCEGERAQRHAGGVPPDRGKAGKRRHQGPGLAPGLQDLQPGELRLREQELLALGQRGASPAHGASPPRSPRPASSRSMAESLRNSASVASKGPAPLRPIRATARSSTAPSTMKAAATARIASSRPLSQEYSTTNAPIPSRAERSARRPPG